MSHTEIVVFLIGLPGSGKGTQAQLLANTGWSHINVGGLVRSEVAECTPWGVNAASVMRRGELLPSEDIQGIIRRSLMHCEFPVVVEGYPRRLAEKDTLPTLCKKDLTLIPVLLEVPRATSVARLLGRLICGSCGKVAMKTRHDRCQSCEGPLISRLDDRMEDIVERRLAIFEKETVPLIDYYESIGELETIDATQDEMAVHSQMLARIAERSRSAQSEAADLKTNSFIINEIAQNSQGRSL